MTADRPRELEQLEENTSSSPSFTFGDIIRMWVQLGAHFAVQNPNEPLNDPILVCVRQALVDAGHVEPGEGDSHGDGDRRFWDAVSPATTFLAEHLPPILPSPAHDPAHTGGAGPSTSTPLQPRLIHDFGASALRSRPETPTGHVARSVQAPDCENLLCPVHGHVLAVCATHGVTTIVRRAPLNSADNARGERSRRSLADTESIGSFTVSATPSPANSLYTTPERIMAPLPDVDDAAAAATVQYAPVAVAQPVPVAAQPVPIAAQPVPVVAQAVPVVAAQPAYVAHIADEGSDNYYVVTRGRTVGVFDNWAMMVASVSRVSSGSGRGGFHTRAAALAAFRSAEALGIVAQRED
ncbi:hypothetical protein K466DRAFT_605590 [Polyporus arcularius HHB13444]|uniref:Ribonuclease H1 N-terminal domain-containing protein n=1 Tax=Polyporus arcularius HHB13444 TaxID=1314778 RepID=A0A5C3NU74_9APHY|nr:hypothetical protein K466DRAFT_605590 [Polyporus arcularius HHB13444]